MSDKTKIEWADASWNPIVGCSKIAAGCANCYAERQAQRIVNMGNESYRGVVDNWRWTGKTSLVESALSKPLHWRKPRRIFVCSMGDLWHESVPFGWIAAVFGVMAATPRHTYMVPTKRPGRALEWFRWLRAAECVGVMERSWIKCHAAASDLCSDYSPAPGADDTWPPPNVHFGVSISNQEDADRLIPDAVRVPAAKHFVSAEPLLGPVDLARITIVRPDEKWGIGVHLNALTGHVAGPDEMLPRLDLVIVGGESGPGARLMRPHWVRSIRDQCRAAGAPFMFKQWGEWAPPSQVPGLSEERSQNNDIPFRVGKKAAGRLLDGVEHNWEVGR